MIVTDLKICTVAEIGDFTPELYTFSLNKPNRSQPFVLKGIAGLDPNEIIKTYNDGWQFFRVRPKDRIVTLRIKCNPDTETQHPLSELRDGFYRMISYNTTASKWNSDSKLELRFMNGDKKVASLFGFIVRFESNIFTSEPDIIISFECDDPFLRDTDYTILTDKVDLTPSGKTHFYRGETYKVGSSFTCTDNHSTAPHGFKMAIKVVSQPSMDPPKLIVWDNRNPSLYLFSAALDFHNKADYVGEHIKPGDIIHFSSEEDDRYVFVDRNGIGLNMINHIYWGSIWPYLWPGKNRIEVSEGMQIYDVRHRYSYWGI